MIPVSTVGKSRRVRVVTISSASRSTCERNAGKIYIILSKENMYKDSNASLANVRVFSLQSITFYLVFFLPYILACGLFLLTENP
jgi:hypothetical protein